MMNSKGLIPALIWFLIALHLGSCTPAADEVNAGIELTYLDKNIQSHNNFYMYANGGWYQSTQLTSSASQMGLMQDLVLHNNQQMLTLVQDLLQKRLLMLEVQQDNTLTPDEKRLQGVKMSPAEIQVADLFRLFMDERSLNQQPFAVLQSVLNRIKGIRSINVLMEYMGYSRTLGVDAPLNVFFNSDAKQPHKRQMYLWQSGLSLPNRDYYLNSQASYASIRKAYLQHIQYIFGALGSLHPEEKAKTVLIIESALAKSQASDEQNRPVTAAAKTVAFRKLHPYWQRYLKAMGTPANRAVVISQPLYLAKLTKLMRQFSLEDWKIYFTWRLVQSVAPLLHQDIASAHSLFFDVTLRGASNSDPRAEQGVQWLNQVMPDVMGALYVEKYLPQTAQQRVSEMVEQLKLAYQKRIQQLTWMEPKTKRQAWLKIKSMHVDIAIPAEVFPTIKTVAMTKTIVEYHRMFAGMTLNRELQRLTQTSRQPFKGIQTQHANIFFVPQKNQVVMTAAILQPPLFDWQSDAAAQYGLLGSLLGHEMSYVLNEAGTALDAQGKPSWWQPLDHQRYGAQIKKVKTFLEKQPWFSALRVSSDDVVVASIADLMGLKVAFDAYQDEAKQERTTVIAGLSGAERFFIGFAQVWRRKTSIIGRSRLLILENALPPEMRVNAVLSLMPDFYRVYHLKPGQPMYIPSSQQAEIW
jgi:putative endopeptidase